MFAKKKNERSLGKLSPWQLLLSRCTEVFPLPVDDQRSLQTVVLGDEVLQNLDDDDIR